MTETKNDWKVLIQRCEDAGVDGLELNFGCPHGMCERGMGSSVGQEPKLLQEITSWTKDGIASAATGGQTGDFNCDIIFANGQFFQWPQGTQT